MSRYVNAKKALDRFERATRAHAFKGAQPVEEHKAICLEFQASRDDVLRRIRAMDHALTKAPTPNAMMRPA